MITWRYIEKKDIIDILDSAYQELQIIGIHNNKDLSGLVFEVIEFTMNSYLEELMETESFVYEALPEDEDVPNIMGDYNKTNY